MRRARLAFRLALPTAYRAADFLAFHGRDAAATAERVDGNVLHKAVVWAERPACLTVRFGARQAAVELAVRFRLAVGAVTRKVLAGPPVDNCQPCQPAG